MNWINKIIMAALFPFSMVVAESDTAAVAVINDQKITLKEFRIAYIDLIKQPNIFDSRKVREEFLDDLIVSRILAAQAKKQGLEADEYLQYKLDAYKNKCLVDLHFETFIKPQISPSETEIEEAYQFSQEERSISHLFFNNKTEADSFYNLLKNGVEFNELAKKVFKDSSLANRGGNIGFVNWDQLDYDFAVTAFREPLDSFSIPVKSPFGYHIIKVMGYKKKPMITRQEYQLYRNKAKQMLEYKIGDKLANEYVTNMARNAKITVNTVAFGTIESKLQKQFTRKPGQFDGMLEAQLKPEEIKKLEDNLWNMRNDEIANVNGRRITAAEFIGAINYVPYEMTYTSIKKALDYVLRNFLLISEAENAGLKNNPELKIKADLFEENYLQMQFRRALISGVTVSESEIKEEYAHRKDQLNGGSFNDYHNIIGNELMGEKKRNAVNNYITTIISSVSIKKYPQRIHDYYDNLMGVNK